LHYIEKMDDACWLMKDFGWYCLLGILIVGMVGLFSSPAGALEQKISPSNQAWHTSPAISGDSVVWMDSQGNSGIYLYDIPSQTVKRLSSDQAVEPEEPTIDGNQVIWVDHRSDAPYSALFRYDSLAGTEVPLPHHPAPPGEEGYLDQWNPSVSGDLVAYWVDNPWGAAGSDEIWVYNMKTGQFSLISGSSAYETKGRPKISGTKVVWADNRAGNFNIYLYDYATHGPERQITNSPKNEQNPDISGNRIVWEEDDTETGNVDIIMYDLATGTSTQITNDPAVQRNPAIDKDQIVWDDERTYQESGLDIYRYNITTGTTDRITMDRYDQRQPDVSNGRIVWEDWRNGVWDVYLYTDLIASFTATPTSGTAPLTVLFTDTSTGSPTSWIWSFGDGDATNATLENPVHTFRSAGTYTVSLTAMNTRGSDTMTKTGYITVNALTAPALVSAVVPTSRTTVVGSPVTVLMSVINAGTSTAHGVSITQASSLPVAIIYQEWNPTSGTFIGTPNTPVDIPAGGTANFVLAITPSSAFSTSPLTFTVAGTDTGGAAPIWPVNTLTMRATSTAAPDVIMMSTNYNVQTGVNTPTAFAIATTNVGGAAATGVSLNVVVPASITGLSYTLSQTDPATGAIIGPATGLTINPGAQPTFVVFLTPTQPIPMDLVNNRITAELVDGSGNVVGAVSVAVSTT
jgi:beta propeller repeat protein